MGSQRPKTKKGQEGIREYLLQLNWPIEIFIFIPSPTPVQLLVILMAWKGEHSNCHTPLFYKLKKVLSPLVESML